MASENKHSWLMAESAAQLRPVSPPAGKRIAVLAPHPDDELLGCAGTLLRAREEQPSTHIQVLYLTTGSLGSSGEQTPEEVTRIRREESARGLAVLGIQQAEHASFEDGALKSDTLEIERVAQFLEGAAPEIVMIPVPLDPHPDHRATVEIVMRILEARPVLQPGIWMYEIQPAFPMNALVRIDGLEARKVLSLREHRSQDADRLTHAALGLAACRALYAPSGWRYAEAFRIASAATFLDFCRSVGF